MEYQRTIKNDISLEGLGLHTGNKARVTFKPLPVNSGINFMRVDLPDRPLIKACLNNILPTDKSPRRTSIVSGNAEVHTIEHLMAVLVGLKIDNLLVELDNNEVPGLDGSGLNFVQAFEKAGIIEQPEKRHYFVIKEPLWAEEGSSSILAIPAVDYRVSYTLDYDHPMLKSQYVDVCVEDGSFKDKVSVARTFCLESEAEELKKQGLGKGANYDNTLVVSKKDVIKNKLRLDDEFARHKVLDLLGDMYLLGMPIKGHIIALRSGHSLNIKLLKKINQQKEKYAAAGIVSGGYMPNTGEELDATTIMKILPHRYPFLLVDRIISLSPGKGAVGIKNVTMNEHFFVGHFPNKPVMPGVLIVEAMAQVGGVLMLSPPENRGKIAYFMSVDNVKFRKPVVPGDQLIMKVDVVKLRSRTGQIRAEAFVDEKMVAEADLMFALAEE